MSDARFSFSYSEGSPDAQKEAIRKTFDLIATFFADEGVAVEELQRLLNDDVGLAMNALYGALAVASGLIRAAALEEGVEPLDVVRRLEDAAGRAIEDGGVDDDG